MKLPFSSFVLAFFLAAIPNAFASTTWYVNGVTGSDGNTCLSPITACLTIAHAISLASSGDSISVAPATYTENLTISISLKILGANAGTTIVDGSNAGGVFTIKSHAAVTLSELTIQNGSADYGAGIDSEGKLTVSHSTISGNFGLEGGGIANTGRLTINDSTISGNEAAHCRNKICFGFGGGVMNFAEGTLTINNSTISGNGAFQDGGGVFNSGTVTINSSTISGNSAQIGSGGGINNASTATIQNSIVSNSPLGGDCSGTMTSEGYNLSDDNTCNLNGPGDLNDTKAKLGTLGNHGGPTQTIPEALDSPTVDAGNPSGCTDSQGHLLTTDQRGYPRPGKYKHDHRCDMGAYESQTD